MPMKKMCSIVFNIFFLSSSKSYLKILSIMPSDIQTYPLNLLTLNFCSFFIDVFLDCSMHQIFRYCRYLDYGLQKCLWKLPFKYYIKVSIRKKINIVSILHQPIIMSISLGYFNAGTAMQNHQNGYRTNLLTTSALSVPGFNWSDGYHHAFLSLST